MQQSEHQSKTLETGTIKQLDLIGIYRTLPQLQQNTNSSQAHMEHSPRKTTYWDTKHIFKLLKE